MRYISLFAGIGGFDAALRMLGHECVYANEWNKYAATIYEKNFGHRPDTRSITDVDARELPDADLLVAGFPCQAFSVAGKRQGFLDTRGTLFHDLRRVADAKRPTYLFFENVEGLLNHDDGRTFSVIMRSLDELGYELQWQVCNSRHFGVPQNRSRVFIVGHSRGTPRPQVFPLTGEDYAIAQALSHERKGTQSVMAIATNHLNQNGRITSEMARTVMASEIPHIAMVVDHGEVRETEVANAIDASYYKGLDNHGQRTGILEEGLQYVGGIGEPNRIEGGVGLSREYKQGSRVYSADGIAATLSAQGTGGPGGHTGLYEVAALTERGRYNEDGEIEQQPEIRTDGVTNALTVGHGKDYVIDTHHTDEGPRFSDDAPTLTANGYKDPLKVHTHSRIRKLTPTECERLQGFEDFWTEGISDSQRYRVLGNAVTVNVIYAIARHFPL